MARHFGAVLAAAALALASGAVRAQADDLPHDRNAWIEARTAHFLLWSDAGERHTRELGANLEQLRAALMLLDTGAVAGEGRPSNLYVFKNRSALAPYLLRYQGKREELAGYFLSSPLANYMAMDGDARGPAERIIYHEYLHYLLHSRYSHLPLWLDEGLAEYFSSFQVADGEARFGMPIAEHIRWLRDNNLIPLQQLLAVDHNSKDYHEGIRQGVFYAESWALTHYLMLGNPARRPQLVQMAKLMEGGMPQDQAFARAFGGDYASLDQELRVYVGRRVFAYEHLPLKAAADDSVAVVPLPAADVLYRLGDLLLNLGPEERQAAADHFRAALAADPRHALATAGLGEIAEESQRPGEAQAAYEKAIGLLPAAPEPPAADAAFLHFLLGRSLLQQAHVAPEDAASPARFARAETELGEATKLAPELGEAWSQLGLARLSIEPPPAGTVAALATAHRLMPKRWDVALNLALAHGIEGDRKQADAMLDSARLAGAPPRELDQAREELLRADFNTAGKMVSAGDTAGALRALERIAAATHSDDFHRQVVEQIELLRDAAARNAFADAYNHAVELANHGDLQGAIAQLQSLIASAGAGAAGAAPTTAAGSPAASLPAALIDQARQLLDKLKAAAARRSR